MLHDKLPKVLVVGESMCILLCMQDCFIAFLTISLIHDYRLPDEWVPLNEVQKHRTRTVHISQLPNDVAADLDPSFYRRFSHRKHRRK